MIRYSVTQFGVYRFELQYKDEELKGIIDSFINSQKDNKSTYFTYYTLCRHIMMQADKDDMLLGKEANTYYQQPELNMKEYTRISRLLWGLILEEKIFVDFSNNVYIPHYEKDTIFGIL